MLHKSLLMIVLLAVTVGITSACGQAGDSNTGGGASATDDGGGFTGGFTGGSTGGTTGSTSGGSTTGTSGTTGSTGGGPVLAPSLNCTGAHCNSLTAVCTGSSIQINWQSDGRVGTFRILKRVDGGTNSQFDVGGTSFNDTGISAGSYYIYRVKFSSISASNEATAKCP